MLFSGPDNHQNINPFSAALHAGSHSACHPYAYGCSIHCTCSPLVPNFLMEPVLHPTSQMSTIGYWFAAAYGWHAECEPACRAALTNPHPPWPSGWYNATCQIWSRSTQNCCCAWWTKKHIWCYIYIHIYIRSVWLDFCFPSLTHL